MTLLESDLQMAVVAWSKTMEPSHSELEWLYHVPNGEKRDAATAASLKRLGVKSGILDLGLDVARKGFHGWRCELKKPDGKKPKASADQEKYIAFLVIEGYYVLLSNDFEEVKASLVWYLS